MIGWICFFLLASGTVYAMLSGSADAVSGALLDAPSECITLVIDLCGSLCLFCGLIRVGERSGLVDLFSRFLHRPVGALIRETKSSEELCTEVCMNLSSNFFGLGNAATPYGIRAAGRMARGTFTRSLATFLILNTCSLQLIPSTVLALRRAHGAASPFAVLPAVWVAQIVGCIFGVWMVRLFFREEK